MLGFALAVTLAAAIPVSDYDSCRAWFADQPGSHLLSNRIVDPAVRFPRSKVADSLTVSSSGSGFANDTAQCQISYDSEHQVAMVSVVENGVTQLVLTRVRDDPSLAKSNAVTVATQNGVTLGMSRDQVTAIEGEGTVLQFPDHKALVYDQADGTRLAFWFVDHLLAGVMVASPLKH